MPVDPAASLVLFLFIIKFAYDIFKDVIKKAVGCSCDEALEKSIYNTPRHRRACSMWIS